MMSQMIVKRITSLRTSPLLPFQFSVVTVNYLSYYIITICWIFIVTNEVLQGMIYLQENKLAPVSEAEVRAAFAARLGMPLTGQMLSGTLPFYPTLPGITICVY